MLKKVDFYYFSPTGGTKKVGEVFSKAIAKEVSMIDLGKKETIKKEVESDVIVVALPVFGGRVPSIVVKKLKDLVGSGKKAITLVVYGSRAYEDALVELNDAIEESKFKIVASGAFVAEHSISSVVGRGRPDDQDILEIKDFAKKVNNKLALNMSDNIVVPGNHTYKDEMVIPATPIYLDSCTICGKCIDVCPTEAIEIRNGKIETDKNKCILCMACISECPEKARILPPPVQEKMDEKLSPLKDIRRKNEIFI
ncbi:EFR1 family ferrodoxin [Peptostreptococcus faecalis]|uniref:EFR1 family ferrodoxin n=1 Tax=Peptostreptococcus faecalis TaxID=2045015 RepID=UPI000C7AFE7B|nr:EFR1 family ferrodoxin [Peptostreptococcus faecalis]